MKLPRLTRRPASQLKLIFNPFSGVAGKSPAQLMEIIKELQAAGLVPEIYLVNPDENLSQVVEEALQRGVNTFVVCGGDGTVDIVASALAGKHATLGIIPTGTQNNVALSLGIPLANIPAAVELLTTGKRIKVDVGVATCGDSKRYFLEVCSVGLLSALFPAADEIQHGNLVRIGDLLSTLVTFPPAQLRLTLDHQDEIVTQGHVVLVGNMPYIGPHFRMDPATQMDDGLLEVLIFANLTKLDLIGSAVQIAGGGPEGGLQDTRVKRYHVRRATIESTPAMPVLVDGVAMGEGAVSIGVNRHALQVITGKRPGLAAEPEASAPAQEEPPADAQDSNESGGE